MATYVYIDESGDPGIDGSKVLVIACAITRDPLQLQKIVKKTRHKFKGKLRQKNKITHTNELKGSELHPDVIHWIINKLNNLKDFKVHYVVCIKEQITSDHLLEDKHQLYNYLCRYLAETINGYYTPINIKFDASKTHSLRDNLDNYMKKSLMPAYDPKDINITHSQSHAYKELQIADIMAYCMFTKYENDNNEYMEAMEFWTKKKMMWREPENVQNQ
jgi:hypothetical protein